MYSLCWYSSSSSAPHVFWGRLSYTKWAKLRHVRAKSNRLHVLHVTHPQVMVAHHESIKIFQNWSCHVIFLTIHSLIVYYSQMSFGNFTTKLCHYKCSFSYSSGPSEHSHLSHLEPMFIRFSLTAFLYIIFHLTSIGIASSHITRDTDIHFNHLAF